MDKYFSIEFLYFTKNSKTIAIKKGCQIIDSLNYIEDK